MRESSNMKAASKRTHTHTHTIINLLFLEKKKISVLYFTQLKLRECVCCWVRECAFVWD
jgi:hypothetical protein